MSGKLKYLVYFSIIISFGFDCIEVVTFGNGQLLKLIKYFVVIITFLVVGMDILSKNISENKKIKETLFWKELKYNVIVCTVFLVISWICILKTHNVTYKTIEELIQLFMPFGYAYIIINYLNDKEIKDFMKWCLIISVVAYVIAQGIDVFTWKNLMKISFLDSYSPFESSSFAEIAAGLASFFIYYRKKMPLCAVVSVLFCLLTFKRVFVVQMFCLIFVCFFKIENFKIPRGIIRMSILIVILVTLVFNYLIQKENADKFF